MIEILVFILINPLSLLVFWLLYRIHKRRAKERSRAAPTASQKKPIALQEKQEPSDAPQGMGFSFPLGFPMIIYPLLLLGQFKGRVAWWGKACLILYIVLLLLFCYEAFSKKEFENTRKSDPSINRATWLLNWLLFFVILPLLVWIFFTIPIWKDLINMS